MGRFRFIHCVSKGSARYGGDRVREESVDDGDHEEEKGADEEEGKHGVHLVMVVVGMVVVVVEVAVDCWGHWTERTTLGGH